MHNHASTSQTSAIRCLEEDGELDRLQTQGVIRPIEFAHWAVPIVPVMKSDGQVWLCGVTINKYPIPRIGELFTSLVGGKAFSKLDLSHAYLQIPLDEELRHYVVINTQRCLFK